MKKVVIIVIIILLLMITGCNNNKIINVNDDAEVDMSLLLKSIDEQDTYDVVYRELKYKMNNKYYKYVYNYRTDNHINLGNDSNKKSIIISKEESIYENGIYEHYIYEFAKLNNNKIIHCIYNDSQHYNVELYEEIELEGKTEENYFNFINDYSIGEYTKYNIDLKNTNNYIEEFNKISGITRRTYIRTFVFPEEQIFNFNILDNMLSLSKCVLKYNTNYNTSSKTFSTNSHISLIGYENDIEYTIFIYIK